MARATFLARPMLLPAESADSARSDVVAERMLGSNSKLGYCTYPMNVSEGARIPRKLLEGQEISVHA